MNDEIAWLIEERTTPTTHYWSARQGPVCDSEWSTPHFAVRFARKQDAEAVAAYLGYRNHRLRLEVHDHVWVALPPEATP